MVLVKSLGSWNCTLCSFVRSLLLFARIYELSAVDKNYSVSRIFSANHKPFSLLSCHIFYQFFGSVSNIEMLVNHVFVIRFIHQNYATSFICRCNDYFGIVFKAHKCFHSQ